MACKADKKRSRFYGKFNRFVELRGNITNLNEREFDEIYVFYKDFSSEHVDLI